ncbi:hypothetical protein FO519_010616, partial [Halicephalobus sp. NKZ332]
EQAVAANKASEASPDLLKEYAAGELTDFAVIPVERSVEEKTSASLTVPKIIHRTGSNFINFRLLFNGEKVPQHLHPLVKLYMSLINQSSALVDGKLIPCEELSTKRKAELLSFTLYCQQNKIRIDVLSTLSNTSRVPTWIDTYLNKLVFEKPVIERVLKKILTNAEEQKRQDRMVMTSLWNLLVEVPETIDHYYGGIESQGFYKSILDKLEDEKFANNLIQKLDELKGYISKADTNIHLI